MLTNQETWQSQLPWNNHLFQFMEIDEIRTYALTLPETEECFPFGEDNLVLKTKGKIFIILDLAAFPSTLNYKASPDDIIEQRDQYPDAIFPGFHMNKKHWNTLHLNRQVPSKTIRALVQTSYQLVRK
jgi:predicted DNA-binding protein (MmcQ/YjbR family)